MANSREQEEAQGKGREWQKPSQWKGIMGGGKSTHKGKGEGEEARV